MRSRLRTDRIWMAGGVAAAVLLVLLTWLLLLKPKSAEIAGLHTETEAATARQGTLRDQLDEIRTQNDALGTYKDQLATRRVALPTTAGISNFLRGLQTYGDVAKVVVTSMTVGGPTQMTAADTKIYALPITLTVEGTITTLRAFLVQLQTAQPRAVLVTSINETPSTGTTLIGPATMTIGLQAFVAPGAASLTAGTD